MVAMAGVLALASLVPEPDLAPGRIEDLRRARPVAAFIVERLRPAAVARSPAFLLLPGMVFFSTAWSVMERIGQELRRRRGRALEPLERFRVRRELDARQPPEVALAAARDQVERSGLRIQASRREDQEGHLLVASRGPLGFVGSIVFHFGLLLVLVGVAVSSATRANAELMLVEGFPVELGPEAVVHATRPTAFETLRGTKVSIRDFAAEFTRGFQPVDFASVFEVTQGGARREEVVRVNEPVWLEDFQLTLHRYGFAPELVVTNRLGHEILAGASILTVLPPGTEDALALPDGSELRIALFPDHFLRGGKDASRSLAAVNPVLGVRWVRTGAEVRRARVGVGGEADLGDIRVSFPALRYWADFLVGRDLGLWWIAFGAGLVSLGLGARFLFDPQTIHITATPRRGGTSLVVSVSARYFPALNEERAERLCGRIVERLGAELRSEPA